MKAEQWMVFVIIIVVFLLGLVVVHISEGISIHLPSREAKQRALKREVSLLEAQYIYLLSPRVVETKAESLGMEYPKPSEVMLLMEE